MPMILVKKNPRGKVIRELSSEEETAVKTVCGLKKPATMALHGFAPIFPDTCYHLTHYWPAAADIPVAS
ncbi:hypothetical protein FQI98_23775, partial [Escherichia coli]|nr:hypothetical protein [Escherichia coli]